MIYCKLWLNVLIGLLLYTRIYGQLAINMPEAGNYGEETHMNCTEASFNITNGYTWYKENLIIYDNINGDATGKYKSTHGIGFFTLTITNTVVNDGGEYACNYNFVPKSGTLEIQAQGTTTAKLSSSNQMEFTFKQIYPNTTSANITCDSEILTGSFVSSVADGDRFTCIWQSLETFSTLPSSCSASVELILVIIIEEIAITALIIVATAIYRCFLKEDLDSLVSCYVLLAVIIFVVLLVLFTCLGTYIERKWKVWGDMDFNKKVKLCLILLGIWICWKIRKALATIRYVLITNDGTSIKEDETWSLGASVGAFSVTKVTPGGPADGKLKVEDQIHEINGVAVTEKDQNKIEAMIKEEGIILTLRVFRDGSPNTSIVELNYKKGQPQGFDFENLAIVKDVTGGSKYDGKLKKGDRILSINGKSTAGKSNAEVNKQLKKPPEVLELSIRAGNCKTVKLNLKSKASSGIAIEKKEGNIVVSDIQPESAAAISGEVQKGDRILSINGKSTASKTDAEVKTWLEELPAVSELYIQTETEVRKIKRKVPLGIAIKKEEGKIIVSAIEPQSVAAASGEVKVGDHIQSINRLSTESDVNRLVNNPPEVLELYIKKGNDNKTVKLNLKSKASSGIAIEKKEGNIVVSDIQPESAAAISEQVKVGDCIQSVNGVSTAGLQVVDVKEMLTFSIILKVTKDVTLKELDPDKDGSFGFETFLPSTSTSVTFNKQTTVTRVTPDSQANVVKSVTTNGPAAHHGIKPGDTIVSINGKKTKGKSHNEIKAMLETFGTSISLKIKENDKPNQTNGHGGNDIEIGHVNPRAQDSGRTLTPLQDAHEKHHLPKKEPLAGIQPNKTT